MKTPVRNNRGLSRFEIDVDGSTALLEYSDQDGVMVVTHTFVPPALRGQGLAGILTQFAIQPARQEQKSSDPHCSYAAAYIQKPPEFADVLK